MNVSNGPVIEVAGLEKRYGDRPVLRGVDLDVARGEVFCLLGPNGAGKTTTIEILEGFRPPSEGHVRILGLDPARHPVDLRERTGVVLQSCGFPTHLRVEELIDAWRAYYRHPRPLPELLDIVELTEDCGSLVRNLSGGQRRRLDFALALAGDPELVFLDEPTTGFDPEARRRCWAAIENLKALGKTILLTTHYLDEAEHLADRVGLLTDGSIGAVGTPAELARQAAVPTRISFSAPAEQFLTDTLPGSAAVIDGRVLIDTTDPSSCLQDLLGRVGALPDLAVTPPRLEDAYLALVSPDTTTP